MVYTRSSNERYTAARTLASMKASFLASLKADGPTETQLWSNWTTWYHTFVSEVQDEGKSSTKNRFVEAERRWVTFCAKKLRCDEKYVESWLKNSDVEMRVKVAGF